MAEKDTHLAIENAVEQLEQAPAIVQETHKLKSLRTRLRTMSMLLKELDGQEYEPGVADWLMNVRDVAYKTQEVIGSIVVETNQKSKLGRLLSGGRVNKHHAEEIESIEKSIVNIFDAASSNKESYYSYRSISFKIDEIVGFKDAQETLVRKLIGDAKSQHDVILIHGKAGSGKTTLANMVCNDHQIKEHFNHQEWVSLRQEFPLEELLCRILEHTSSPSNQTDCLPKNELKERFRESLKGKRYLAVIDNVCSSDALDELISLFPNEFNGSRILLASRVTPAELHLQQKISFSYEVKPLDVNQSWQLLSKKVLKGENNPGLEKLGKRMVDKCKGSPRAILSMAAILERAEKTEDMWSKFIEGYDYFDLAEELQFCLLYFGLFPENCSISAKQMIQMWMAEGLLKKESNKRAEEIGEDYVKKLIDQSFIQAHTDRAEETVKACYTYSHIADLCISEGAALKFFEVHKKNNPKPKEGIKRMAIHSESVTDDLKRFVNCSARSLHCFGNNTHSLDFCETQTLLHNFRHLQVLNLDFCLELDKVPKELGKLINLKYLRLRAPNARHLPSSIVNLDKLETLDMRESRLVSLPRGIWKMKFLRHLYLGGSTYLPQTSGIDYYKVLPNLQTLSGVYPGKILKWLMVRAKFPNVRKLRIRGFDSTESKHTFNFLNSLDHLFHLQSLRIEKPTELPDLNAFPLSLTKLTLLETKIQQTSIKTLEKLQNLRILKLLENAIHEKKFECSEGGFLQLEVLYLEKLDVTEWIVGEGAMQSVRRFFIKECDGDILKTAPDHLRRVANFE